MGPLSNITKAASWFDICFYFFSSANDFLFCSCRLQSANARILSMYLYFTCTHGYLCLAWKQLTTAAWCTNALNYKSWHSSPNENLQRDHRWLGLILSSVWWWDAALQSIRSTFPRPTRPKMLHSLANIPPMVSHFCYRLQLLRHTRINSGQRQHHQQRQFVSPRDDHWPIPSPSEPHDTLISRLFETASLIGGHHAYWNQDAYPIHIPTYRERWQWIRFESGALLN